MSRRLLPARDRDAGPQARGSSDRRLIDPISSWLRATNHAMVQFEVVGAMPGDELLLDPSFNAARAIAIDAPRESVWPRVV
jgi:hypothetical protein